MPENAVPAPAAADEAPHWLSTAEMEAWLPLIRMVGLLPQVLDRQLREEAGLTHAYYMLLAILSDQPRKRLALTELARRWGMSSSRASHAVTALEGRGLVARQSCPGDRRVQHVVLTLAGQRTLEEHAPGHVRAVRRAVIDELSADELQQLQRISEKILGAIEEPTPTQRDTRDADTS